jgi:large subunit ribosomal protein L34e
MPNYAQKNRKVQVKKTPGGRLSRLYKKKKPNKHSCAISKKKLSGMPHGKRPNEVAKLSKTQRRPENLLASMISMDVRKEIYLQAVMLKYNIISKDDIDYRYKKYIDMIYNKIE